MSNRPETIAERMRAVVTVLDFYDNITRQYLIPLLEDYLEKLEFHCDDNFKIMDVEELIDILSGLVYPIESSRDVQKDLEEDAQSVMDLERFYNIIVNDLVGASRYSIDRAEREVERFNEDQ